ncbi:hypothetical protein H0H87_006112, partial [Tephrocybe sp. NHM501043]
SVPRPLPTPPCLNLAKLGLCQSKSTHGKKQAAGSSSEAEEDNNNIKEPTCRKSKCCKGGSDDNWEAPPPRVKGRNKGKAKAVPKTTLHPKVQASAAAQRNAESEEEDEEVREEDEEEVREEDKEEVREEDNENELGEDEGGEDEIEGLNKQQAEGIPNILLVKKDSTCDLLLIFSDRCTQGFEWPGGKVQDITGRWYWSC